MPTGHYKKPHLSIAKQRSYNGRAPSSQYRGVSKRSSTTKYQAQIGDGPTYKHLGTYNDEIVAALSYDREALALYGSSARLNAPLIIAHYQELLAQRNALLEHVRQVLTEASEATGRERSYLSSVAS